MDNTIKITGYSVGDSSVSDEIKKLGWSRRMTWKINNEILSNQRKMRILNALD